MVLTLSITLVTILGMLSAVLILGNFEENIGIDPDDVDFNLDFNITSGEINNVNFTLPFNITNAGFFDLEDLNIEIEIAMRYEHINFTLPGQNDTRTVKIFEKSKLLGTIKYGDTKIFNFSGIKDDFINGSIPNPKDQINWYRTPPPDIEFFANFTISLIYSLGLHSLSFGMLNLSIGDYSLP